jgi:hypothetical protein
VALVSSCAPDGRRVVIEDAEVFLLGRSVHARMFVRVRNDTARALVLSPSAWLNADTARFDGFQLPPDPRPGVGLAFLSEPVVLPPDAETVLALSADLGAEDGLAVAQALPCASTYSVVVEVPQLSARHGVHPAVHCILPLRRAPWPHRGVWVWGH